MTPFEGKAKGALHKAGGEGFAASCKQLVEGLGQSFRGNHGSASSEVQLRGEDSGLLCGTGTENQEEEHPAATIV